MIRATADLLNDEGPTEGIYGQLLTLFGQQTIPIIIPKGGNDNLRFISSTIDLQMPGIGEEILVQAELKSGLGELVASLVERNIDQHETSCFDLDFLEFWKEHSLRLHKAGQIDFKTFHGLLHRQGHWMDLSLRELGYQVGLGLGQSEIAAKPE
jgi:hypothetical protein